MMTDSSEAAVPKLVDFGLAKMIGPSQKATEPFGTLGYAAPEILEAKPYNSSCDLWSLGCLIYALLATFLPFDDSDEKETLRLTCKAEVTFEEKVWQRYTPESKLLISKLLTKDPEKRISIQDTLAHPWFRPVRAKFAKLNQNTSGKEITNVRRSRAQSYRRQFSETY